MNKNPTILAIDPGETVGIVRLVVTNGEVVITDVFQGRISFSDTIWCLRGFLNPLRFHIDVVVVEDYRIYPSHAGHHVGAHLYTPELIGAIAALCVLNAPQAHLVRLPASKKGRWPLARLKAKFPAYERVPTPHALDALKIGLAYIDSLKKEIPRWQP